ncbi:hypothetical protein COO09_19375 [Rhizorhabdus dicambivorans]|uniref:Tetratricopeptide repeat protein n=1 Tax=Rhizorhabdus dicambivorans TaxID=1850238 RepID=A0A2A4FRA0_9SPHN|nr:hypothetical protein CMV14_14250 [Rhizorhabdus dicambivorans]PCE40649.1 hypothetical protein COO09_19375 [Rhizorhabdus dicambivorans]
MPRRRALLSAAALILAAAGPAGAAPTTPPGDLPTALAAAQEAAGREDCAAVLRALDPFVPTLEKGDERTLVQRMRLFCLGRESRYEDLAGTQRELAGLLPRDGVVRAFGVLIAAGESRFVDAAEQLATLAATSPDNLDMLTGAAVREISNQLSRADGPQARDAREGMLIALTRADWWPADLPEMRSWFAGVAIAALIRRNEAAEAEGLIDRVDEPELLTAMLVDRQFAALWPAIEAQVGPAGATSVDRYARDRLSAFATSPDSEAALRHAAAAMLLLGRYQDALDMTGGVAVADGMSRDAVQIALLRSRALAALRRGDEAERQLQGFMTVDLERTPEAATALISYAELLDENGHWAQGLEAARGARTRAATYLNEFGLRWLDRTEVCTLSALGRAGEASAAMGRLKPMAAQNHAAAIEALLCARRDAEASALTLEAFKDEDAAGELLLQFQPTGSFHAAAPSRLRDLWAAFLKRPEIKAAFDRRGRILPRAYWQTPEPRDIPRRRGGGDSLT